MRPVLLTAEGFTAFRDRVEVDFEEVEFFALVGPTGSGKSSVIDAMCFALYGCVPRYEDRRAVAPAITVGALEAKVSLTFEVADDRYLAVRVVRRQPRGGATTKEARLERISAGGDTEVLAGNADDVTASVEKLLGLKFDHFTRCVVLPQGEFARFLHDKPAARQDLLVSLLSIDVYERMGQRARQLADAAENKIELQQYRLKELAFATEDARAEAKEHARALRGLRDRVKKGAPGIDALEVQVHDLKEKAKSADAFARLLTDVSVPEAVVRSAEEQRQLDKAVEVATGQVASIESARKKLELEAEEFPDLAGLKAAAADHKQLAGIDKKLTLAEQKCDKAVAHQEASRHAAEEASDEADAAAQTLAQLRRQHSAVDLAGHLVTGEPCPVCLQTVTVSPKHRKPGALTAAERAAEKTTKAKDECEEILDRAGKETASARTAIQGLVDQRDELLGRLRSHPDPEALATKIDKVERGHKALADARCNEDAARAQQRKAQAAADAVRTRVTAAWQSFDTQRDRLVTLGPPTPERGDLLADWTALAEWASVERPRQHEAALAADEAAAAKAADHAQALSDLIDACSKEGLDVAPDSTLAELRDQVVAAVGDADHHLKTITEAIAEAKRLRSQIKETQAEAVVADNLANHLKATGFERWLVSEALDLLVDGASATLRGLSSGQYSLTRDERNEFLVIDHRNADERRPAKTLSGGETFQASLALALALADQLGGLAAGGAAKLESIFLDEGFGTLDPETLATVADTIEALGNEERMVGIVTHVRELAERVPVRFEVTKTARTSRVERQSA